jgi:hypothetical protein
MTVNQEILEAAFTDFSDFIKSTSGEEFEAFATSKYLNAEENYKYAIYEAARENLANKYWKPEDIGTGKIKQKVNSAINARDNNLVFFMLKSDFARKPNSKELETIFFNFYKDKIKDNEAFDQLMDEGLKYQLIAYLFFIKNRQKFLPISQKIFDKIFQQIGIPEFKTSGNCSWENYIEFCGIIKQAQKYLKAKDKNTTLIDAHSFLWILGNQMQEPSESIAHIAGDNYKDNTNTANGTELAEEPEETEAVIDDAKYADELPLEKYPGLFEGIKRTVTVNSYERNKKARQNCISHWKAYCRVCGLDFEKVYGEIGKRFIHIHHVVKISDIGEKYEVDPIHDLIPVCPNCHSMLHKKEPPLSIEELKSIISEAGRGVGSKK